MEDHGHHLADMGGRKGMTLRLGSHPVKRGKTTDSVYGRLQWLFRWFYGQRYGGP